MPAIFALRTSVRENLLTRRQLARLGITPRSLTDLINQGKLGAWCMDDSGVIAGFSMAKRAEREIFALFVAPQYESRGIGGKLLDRAVAWLKAASPKAVRLSTGAGTRAHGFYLHRGWREVSFDAKANDVILELSN